MILATRSSCGAMTSSRAACEGPGSNKRAGARVGNREPVAPTHPPIHLEQLRATGIAQQHVMRLACQGADSWHARQPPGEMSRAAYLEFISV